MNNNITFVAGIHGVGKTTLCKQLFKKYNVKHYSASEIISNAKQQNFKTLFIKDIEKNQVILIDAVNKLLDRNNEYILDGHFCLLNEFKEVKRIPRKTFELLGLKAIIVLIEDISTIHTRLKNSSEEEYDLDTIRKLQEDELKYSKEIADILSIPYLILDILNMSEFEINEKLDSVFGTNF